MRLSFGVLFSFLFVTSVFAGPSQDTAIALLERGLDANESLFEFLDDHSCKLGLGGKKCDEPLTALELQTFKLILRSLENWRVQTFDIVVPENDVLGEMYSRVQAGDYHRVEEKTRRNPFTWANEKYLLVTYAPSDLASLQFVQKVKITTASVLQLYDSFFRVASLLRNAKKLRSIIENDMPEEGKFLSRTYSLALNRSLFHKLERDLRFLDQVKKIQGNFPALPESLYFDDIIQNSMVGEELKKNTANFIFRAQIFLRSQVAETWFLDKIETIVGDVSGVFGNLVGQVQTREGKLKTLARNAKLMTETKASFKPLDVLLEKTPFRLTDRFIPGHYGHVAIWLGTYAELEPLTVDYQGSQLPLLSHPDVIPHLGRLLKGQAVEEALRTPGVTLNTFEHFLDVDDLLVLRPRPTSAQEYVQNLLRAFQQVGKPYDFSFDVETERAIVCSELAYMVFVREKWPTSKSLGRYTISPDHVAVKGLDGSFEPILMYRDGVKVTHDLRGVLERLLEPFLQSISLQ